MYLFPKKNREYIFVSGKKLYIGDILSFTLSKRITINENEYLLFLDSSNEKYLVPAHYYENYNFETGQKIQGWIDKINCTGRIFIEPMHPNYNIGDIYSFDVFDSKIIENNNETMTILYVRDIFNNSLEVSLTGKIKNVPAKIACCVKKIKKGQLYLSAHK